MVVRRSPPPSVQVPRSRAADSAVPAASAQETTAASPAASPDGIDRGPGQSARPGQSPDVAGLRAAARAALAAAQEARHAADQAQDALLRAELPVVSHELGALLPPPLPGHDAETLSRLQAQATRLEDKSAAADRAAHDALNAVLHATHGAGQAPHHVRLGGHLAPLPARLSQLLDEERAALAGQPVPDRIARVAQPDDGAARRATMLKGHLRTLRDAVDGIDGRKKARNRATLAAVATVARTVADAPAELRPMLLHQARPVLMRLSLALQDLGPDDTRAAVEQLSAAAETLGPAQVFLLTSPLASEIAAGSLEEDNTFLNRRRHRSEQELCDAVHAVMNDTGHDLFARSLCQQLVVLDDLGFAQAVAVGGAVPGKNTWERGSEQLDDALRDVSAFVGDLANSGGDYLRERIADLSGIDHKIAELNSKGDKFTLGLEVEVATGAAVYAAAELEVKRKKHGHYEVTISGAAGAGIFGALGAKAGLFGGALDGEAYASGFVEVEAHFDTREEALAAARAIAGIGIASGLTGPVGALVVGATAKDELRPFLDGLHATRLGIELEGKAELDLGFAIGHGGLAAENEIKATASATVELRPGRAPALVVASELEGESVLRLGHEKLKLPGGGELELGSVGAKGTVSLETSVSLEGMSLRDVLRDPVKTVRGLKSRLAEAETTLAAEVTLEGLYNAEGDLPLHSDMKLTAGGAAVTAELAATLPHKDLGESARRAFGGDLKGALSALSDEAVLEVETHALDKRGFDIEAGIEVGIFAIGVAAEYLTEDKTKMFAYEGSPRELLDEAADFFHRVTGSITA